jgi:TonB-linked SusC/RagA family outer membrane protein
MKHKLFSLAFVAAALLSLPAFAQSTVTGTVTSASNGETLPSVAVRVKGTNVASVTNFNGSYSISAGQNAVLVFSALGYASQEVSVTGSVLNVKLKLATTRLDDVVVTAGGVEKQRRALGFGVEEIKGSAVKASGESNFISGLSAKVSGVQVTNSSGAAGAASYIKIRGNATFTSSDNQPLMVVDGVPIDNSMTNTEDLRGGVAYSNRAMDINPDDIETISVLKGGAAAALYGTRGANGVILITTKKGAYGQAFRVDVNSSAEFTEANQLPRLQSKFSQGIGTYGGGTTSPFSWGPGLSELGYDANGSIVSDPSLFVGDAGVDAANPYDFFKRGLRLNNAVTVSGGTERSTYYLSVSNLADDGIIPLNRFDRTTVRLTGSGQITSKLKATGSLAYTSSGGYRIQQGSNVSGLMLGLLRTPPSFDNSAGYENADGTQRTYRNGGGYDNPYWTVNKNPFQDKVSRTFGYVQLDYALADNILVNYKVGLDAYSDTRQQIIAKNSRSFPAGSITNDVYNWEELNQDLQIRYNEKFGDFGVAAMAGFNSNQRQLRNVWGYGSGLVIPNFYNMSNATNQQTAEGITRRRIWGLYGEGTLDYKNYLFLTLTARRDQASTFGDVGTPILYPSGSLGLVLTDALNIKSDVLNFWKLRASQAKVGIEPGFGSNATYFNRTQVGSGWVDGLSFPFMGQTGFTMSDVLGNPGLTPEFTVTSEIGTEFRMFNNRLNVDMTYYNQESRDLIIAVPVAGSSGFTSAFINAGSMYNRGIEIAASADLVKSEDFNWNTGITYTRNRNKVTSLAEGVDVVGLPWGFFGANQRLMVGQAYGTLYGDDWQRNEDGVALVDEFGYPVYSSTEVVVGDPNPDFLLGWTNDISYKNWSFNMLWDIRQGGDIWNGTRGALMYFGTHGDTESMTLNNGDVVERGGSYLWHDNVSGTSCVYAPGTVIDGNDVSGQANMTQIEHGFNSYANGPLSGFTGASRPFIEDGSWIRLRQIGLSYSLPEKVLAGTGLKGLSLSAQGRNLFLSTPYTGVDPETNLSGATNSQGADYFNMPNTKGYIFSLKANF